MKFKFKKGITEDQVWAQSEDVADAIMTIIENNIEKGIVKKTFEIEVNEK